MPEQAIFPLTQHIGKPAIPVVGKGDTVKVGSLIAEADGQLSAPVYSSVSGTVAAVGTAVDESGSPHPAIIIDVEGDEWEPSIDRSDNLETLAQHPELTPEEVTARI